MSPRKEPETLFNISCNHVVSIAKALCQYVSSTVDNEEKEERIRMLQEHFLDYLPIDIFDLLCSRALPDLSFYEYRSCGYNKFIEPLLSLFIHNNMRFFYPSNNVRLLMSDAFWISKMPCFKKIVVLSLHKVCTDEILEQVGAHCALLQVINITSKTCSFERNKRLNMNALKLRYCVSDDGLQCLSKCKQLRQVIISSLWRNQCNGRMVTKNGILQLVRSLPALQFISYQSLGTIVYELSRDEQSPAPFLSLFHIQDDNCQPEHIRAMSAICPGLQSLSLTKNGCKLFSCTAMEDETAFELCESALKLRYLLLQGWPVTGNLHRYIQLKGNHLQSLILECRTDSPISSNELVLIGECCPQLEKLHVAPMIEHQSDFNNLRLAEKRHLMRSLISLNLHGESWSPQVCFALCLRHAPKLRVARLTRSCIPGFVLDEHILQLLRYNTLSALDDCFLGVGLSLTRDVVLELINRCRSLTKLYIPGHDLNTNDINDLHAHVKSNNLNLELNCDVTYC